MGQKKGTTKNQSAPKKVGPKPTRQADTGAVLKVIAKAKGGTTTRDIAEKTGAKDTRAVGNAVRALIREGKVAKIGGARGNTARYGIAAAA